jgi:hypothetical protein
VVKNMSTLNVVEEILRETRTPMVVREIVNVGGTRLPTRSKTPDTVVARDLAMDIKRRGDESKFIRVSPGKYTLRELVGVEGMDAAGVEHDQHDQRAPHSAPHVVDLAAASTQIAAETSPSEA